jgi:hypothetical protein
MKIGALQKAGIIVALSWRQPQPRRHDKTCLALAGSIWQKHAAFATLP